MRAVRWTPARGHHIPGIVDAHVAAFPASFTTSLGAAFLTEYYGGLVDVPASSIVLVVEDVGKVAGFAAGALSPRSALQQLYRRRWLRFSTAILAASVARPSLLAHISRGVRNPARFETMPTDVGLFSIAVHPAFQGEGIGSFLLAGFVEEARRRGGRRVVLHTESGPQNAAHRLYRKAGFLEGGRIDAGRGRILSEYHVDLED